MSVTPYSSKASKRVQVEQMFDAISPKYDFLNRLFSMGIDQRWRKRTIRLMAQEPAAHVLDVATGTADLAIMASRHAQRVTGIDISAGMLAGGREKVKKLGLADRVELIQADSEHLPFADLTFDAITVAFGVRNFEHLEKGIAEMARVLKPRARLFVLEFSKPSGVMRPLFHFYFHRVMPAIGKLVSKDARAYTYLPESVEAFPEGPAFCAILERCGLKEVRAIALTGGIATLYIARK